MAASRTPTMREAVISAFHAFVEFLPSELAKMRLDLWTESVARYFYCRCLGSSFPEVERFIECDRVDLVLSAGEARAFIEFKFYLHPPRVNPYDGSIRGFKGRPSSQNRREFDSCAELLCNRSATPELSKYIVLVYADPVDGRRSNLRYADQYDEYSHPKAEISVVPIACSDSINTAGSLVRARLYEVSCSEAAPAAAGTTP